MSRETATMTRDLAGEQRWRRPDTAIPQRIPDDLVSVRTAAAKLGVTDQTVWAWIRAGRVTRYGHRNGYRVSLAECANPVRFPLARLQ